MLCTPHFPVKENCSGCAIGNPSFGVVDMFQDEVSRQVPRVSMCYDREKSYAGYTDHHRFTGAHDGGRMESDMQIFCIATVL